MHLDQKLSPRKILTNPFFTTFVQRIRQKTGIVYLHSLWIHYLWCFCEVKIIQWCCHNLVRIQVLVWTKIWTLTTQIPWSEADLLGTEVCIFWSSPDKLVTLCDRFRTGNLCCPGTLFMPVDMHFVLTQQSWKTCL